MAKSLEKGCDSRGKMIRPAFVSTIPVLTGYLVLGIGFGILLKASGYGVWMAFFMSLLIYAGSMQYVAVGLLSGGASLLTAGVTALMVNARHLFYGISMLEKYRKLGFRKPYLIFTLTDETYSLVCSDHPEIPADSLPDYYFLVSLFDHMYWVAGSVLGALVGAVITFNTEGIDFALTALFLTVFTEQWLSTQDHVPALVGVGASVLCLILFGPNNFLIPTMIVIGITLCLRREEVRHG